MVNHYPVSTLHIASKTAVAVSGPHYQLYDTHSGSLLASSTALQPPVLDALLTSGPIRCSRVDPSEKYLVTSGDDKILKVWQLHDLQLLSARELPKKPTCILFTSDGQSILVADKFGDVFRYSLHPGTVTEAERVQKEALASNDNPARGDLVLGHVSLLTSILLSSDERYIISADRDEHIRVSCYPQAYSIESFCLGHTKFVSSIHIPTFDTSKLVSGGGDTSLMVWDWMKGQLLFEIPVWEAIEPFIVVSPQKRRRQDDDDDEGDDTSTKIKRGKRNRKGKREQSLEEDVDMNMDAGTPLAEEPQSTVAPEEPEPKKTLVIDKIHSFEFRSKQYLVFSAVGATALFACRFPNDRDSAASISHVDLHCPVLDFSTTADGRLWAVVDSKWADSSDTRHVRVVQVTENSDSFQLVELGDDAYPTLAKGINSIETRVTASDADLAKLELYQTLSSMPKHADAEHDAMDREAELKRKGKNASKKELGRLKRKEELAAINPTSPSGDELEKTKRQKSQ